MDNNSSANSPGQRKFVERRRRKDWLVRSVNIIAVVGWLCALTALALLSEARPTEENLFTRLFGVEVAGSWNTSLINIAYGAVVLSFCVCVAGLCINMTRHRRKSDRYNKSIIILGVISFVLIIVLAVIFYL